MQAADNKNKLSTSIVEELWFGEDDREAVSASAADSFAAKLAEVEGLRPFPVVVQKLIVCVADPSYRVEQVRAIIGQDPALSTRVLRVANSVAFQTREPCHSIQDAIVRMGARTVTDLACGMAAMTRFQDLKGDGQLVREHCAGTAAVARAAAYRAHSVRSPEVAFVAGLLHDIGKLLLLQTRDAAYAELPGLTSSGADEFHVQEREALGYDHAVLGGHVLAKWGLPEPLPKAVAWHHQPTRAYDTSAEIASLVAVLRIADFIDTMIARQQPLNENTLQRMARSPDSLFLEFQERDWVALFTEAPTLRIEATGLFR